MLLGLLLAGSASASAANRVTNGNFDDEFNGETETLMPWAVGSGIDGFWSFEDLTDRDNSGSAFLRLMSEVSRFGEGLHRCIDVSPGEKLEASAEIEVITGASPGRDRGELQIRWRPEDGCAGISQGEVILGEAEIVGRFTPISNTTDVPAAIESASVIAAIVREDAATDFRLWIDGISVVAVPEPGVLLGQLAALMSLAAIGCRVRSRSQGTARTKKRTIEGR